MLAERLVPLDEHRCDAVVAVERRAGASVGQREPPLVEQLLADRDASSRRQRSIRISRSHSERASEASVSGAATPQIAVGCPSPSRNAKRRAANAGRSSNAPIMYSSSSGSCPAVSLSSSRSPSIDEAAVSSASVWPHTLSASVPSCSM